MTQNTPIVEQRFSNIENRLDRVEDDFRERTGVLLDGLIALSQQTTALANRLDRLTERLDRLTERVDRLTERVDFLAQVMVQFARDAETDRTAIRENQAEIRRIWEYLLRQSPNGHSGQ